MLLDFFSSLGAWSWLLLGLILITIEMATPGIFFIWIGLAALLTGAIDGVFDLSWQIAFLVFACLSVLCVFAGRWIDNYRKGENAEFKSLNRRAERLIGQTFVLAEPIANGSGRIRVQDSTWRVTGPDMVSGARVRVIGVDEDGSTLIVASEGV